MKAEFIHQLNVNFFVLNEQINGKETLGENIADNGGIKESFNAFRSHEAKYGKSSVLPGLNFTADQLFFVSYAHVSYLICEFIYLEQFY